MDEFKGKVPVVRKGLEFRCEEGMFDNPFLSSVYEVRSGATRSAGTRIRIDFDYLHQRSMYDALLLDVHGCLNAPVANWFPVFPGAPGINSSLRFAHIGNPVRRWFSQVSEDRLKVNWEKKIGTGLIFAVSKLYGCPLAEPEYAGLNEGYKVAEWAAQMISEHGRCVVYTFCRFGGAGLHRSCGSEPQPYRHPFSGDRRTVDSTKKRIQIDRRDAMPVYGISEAGVVAAGCNQPHAESDHCHLYKDTTAIITHHYSIPHFSLSLDSCLFTSLLYESPKLLLNVGMGDYADIEPRSCNCGFAGNRFRHYDQQHSQL